MLKFKLPASASAYATSLSLYTRALVKIPNLLGWDIAYAIAKENSVEITEFAKSCDLQVCSDHVMLDVNSLDDNTLLDVC